MNKKIIGFIIVVIMIIGGIWVMLDNKTLSDEDPIRIGAILPLTNLYAENGENSLNGYNLAVEEINNKGGVNGRKVELVVESHDGGSNAEAVSAYRNLKLKGINLILGPNHSNTGLSVVPVACEEKSLLLSPAIGAKGFAQTCETILNVWPVDFSNSKTLGKLVVNQGYERIAVAGSVQPWEFEQANAVKEGVEESNGNLVHMEITNNTPSNYTTEATKILASNPDAVVFTNYGYMDLLAKKIREFGSDAKFFVVILDETRKNNAAGAFEGSLIISSYTPTDNFTKRYEEKYGRGPDFPADTSYDALNVLIKTIKKTDSVDPTEIAEEIMSYKNYKGASGVFTFTETGDVIKSPVYQTVKDNQIVEINL